MAKKSTAAAKTETGVVMSEALNATVAAEAPAAAEAPKVAVLVIKGEPILRPGTAAEAVWAAIAACKGTGRDAVLLAAKTAEQNWHKEAGRVVKAVAPAGWLRKWAALVAFE